MAEIRLTPYGHLRWRRDAGDASAIAALSGAFEADWREGLFRLAADKPAVADWPTLRYWQGLAEQYLTALCHVPEATESVAADPPTPAELASLLLTAPPMVGGEYLSEGVLRGIWQGLDEWVRQAVRAAGDLKTFLESQAPKWHQVGRVCFHLAENKNDEDHPFAFLATYATGFGSGGRLKHLPLGRALEQYAGTKNRAALIKLLSPVQSAAERCDWVGQMTASGQIYRPQAWSPATAYRLLQDVPALEACGLSVRLPDWWKRRPRAKVSVVIGQVAGARLGAEAMLDFDVNVALGDASLSPNEIAALLAGDDGLVWFKGQWVEVDREKLRQVLEHWQAMRHDAQDGRISFVEGMRLLAGASADLKNEVEAEADRPWVHIEAAESLRQVLSGLRDPAALAAVESGDGLKATLRPYQREGVAWLHFLSQLGLGACLADDMGLGKTLQVLSLLLSYKGNGQSDARPSLLVVPASLLGNWRKEAARFTPSLKLTFLHPAENSREALDQIAADPHGELAGTDLAVTTYSMLVRQEWLAEIKWRVVILDEAQAIKNPSTRQARASKNLQADARIVLTGTPVENRLGDLWSLFDFINPGLLGSSKVFDRFVKSLQARSEDRFGPLRRLVAPYILRRLKTDRAIISDLPEKIETTCFCRLSKAQIKLYEATVRMLKSRLADADGIARRGLVLQSLMRLKQICNHPSQLAGDGEYASQESGKFLRIGEICEEIASRQEKVLVFTQFREICDPLADYLSRIFGRDGLILHGGVATGKRSAMVEAFGAEDGPPVFVLSLKAGGIGLNLTAASHIIHFDRWWNPAVENQATDRAFRIGQRRNVLVHKCVTVGTVEERIDAMLAEKQKMADEILASDDEVNLTELSDDELLDMVRLDVSRAQI